MFVLNTICIDVLEEYLCEKYRLYNIKQEQHEITFFVICCCFGY